MYCSKYRYSLPFAICSFILVLILLLLFSALARKQPLHNLSPRRHLPFALFTFSSFLTPILALLVSRPCSSLCQKHRIKPRVILDRDIRPGTNKRLDAV